MNSRMENGEIKILYRDLVTKETADKQTRFKTITKYSRERAGER